MQTFYYQLLTVLTGGCLLVGASTGAASGAERPNFIVFITDDISQEDLGCYGNPAARTPNLDQLAAGGLKFNNAYLTCSSCSPSRCSLITGRYPHNTGACELHTELPAGHFLFPQALREHGYYTVLSGKHHMGQQANPAFSKISAGTGPGKEEDWVQLLRDRPRDQPFFCWFASTDAHRGWQFNADAPRVDPASVVVPPYLVDGPKTRQDLADYYHEVSRSDTFVGRLVDELKAQGIAQDTYLIYMTDNGRPFPRCKTRVYDSGVKSPLIIGCPGRIKPAVTQSLVSINVDLGPTILELAGVPKSSRLQGVSFAAILSDPSVVTRDFVFAEHNWHVMQAHQRMVRQGELVYIRNAWPELQAMCVESGPQFPAGRELWDAEGAGTLPPEQRDIFQIPRPAEELYDLSSDPHQLKNVIADAKYAQPLQLLRGALGQWTDQTRDSIPSQPTPDRQNAQGKQRGGWRHGLQPGIEVGSLDTNHPGPVKVSDLTAWPTP